MPSKLAALNGTLILLGLLTMLVGASLRFGFGVGLMTFGAASSAVYFWNTRGARNYGNG